MENDSFPHDLWWFTHKKLWFPIATFNIHRIIGSMISYREMPQKKLDTINEWIELGQKFSEAPGSECSDPNGLALMIQDDQTSEGAHGHPGHPVNASLPFHGESWRVHMVPWSCSVAFQSLVSTCWKTAPPSHMIPIWSPYDPHPYPPRYLGSLRPWSAGTVRPSPSWPWSPPPANHRGGFGSTPDSDPATEHGDTWRPPNPSMF